MKRGERIGTGLRRELDPRDRDVSGCAFRICPPPAVKQEEVARHAGRPVCPGVGIVFDPFEHAAGQGGPLFGRPQAVPGVVIAPQIIVADLRVLLDHGENRVPRQGRDRVPVKEVPRDQDGLHAVPVRVIRETRKIAQKFIPPAFGKVLIKMGLQPGVQMQVCTMYQLQLFIFLAESAVFPT